MAYPLRYVYTANLEKTAMGAAYSEEVMAELLAADSGNDAAVTRWTKCVSLTSSPDQTIHCGDSPRLRIPALRACTLSTPTDNVENSDYLLVRKIGEGGMGVVFEAEQRNLSRRVALKMIRHELVAQPLAHSNFFYEASLTAQMDHPGILPILDFGTNQTGRVFYAMKKVDGTAWSRVIREKTLQENLDILLRVTDIAGYAHSRGVLHRDIKPANVLLGDFGEVLLGDWGVATPRSASKGYLEALPGGTPQYMAPEMAKCDNTLLGPASDIYLLGAVLFEIVAGRPPHGGDNAINAILSASRNAIPDIDKQSALMNVAYRAMVDDPGRRFASAAAFKKAIGECLVRTESDDLCQEADNRLVDAVSTSDYELFRQVVAGYDAAIQANASNHRAKTGRSRAIAAHVRVAVERGEFDLARSIASQEPGKAAALQRTIDQAQKKARRRRSMKLRILLYVGLPLLSVVAIAGYYFIVYSPVLREMVMMNRNVRGWDKSRRFHSIDSRIMHELSKIDQIVAHYCKNEDEKYGTRKSLQRKKSDFEIGMIEFNESLADLRSIFQTIYASEIIERDQHYSGLPERHSKMLATIAEIITMAERTGRKMDLDVAKELQMALIRMGKALEAYSLMKEGEWA